MQNKCLICNSDAISKKYVSDIELLYCNNCDIHYNSKIPTQDELSSYYSEEYVLEKDELKPIQRYFHRIPEYIDLYSKILEHKNSDAKLLDIGCDKGFFLDFGRHFGFSGVGVEPSKRAREYANKLGLNVVRSIDEVQSKQDIIVLWHSLEHFPEPHSILQKVNSLLNSDGILLVRVPDFGCFWRKIFSKRWIWFQPQNHYFHYSKKSLTNLLESNDFEIICLNSSRPNNIRTLRANSLANNSLKKHFNLKPTLKSRILIAYEYFTAYELFAIAKKKN